MCAYVYISVWTDVVYTCIYLGMHVCLFVCVGVYVHTCVEAIGQSLVLHTFPFVIRPGLELDKCSQLAVQCVTRVHTPPLPSSGITNTLHHAHLLYGFCGI